MRIPYTLGRFIALPLLPIIFYQGKRIRATIPRLPESTGPQGSASCENAVDTPLRLITLGESTIAGVGVSTHEEGFTGELARRLAQHYRRDVQWRVYAESGATARYAVESLVPSITASSADLIVVGLGANDAFTLNSPRRWAEHIGQLIDSLRTRFPRTPIVFCNMPPIKEFPAFTGPIRWVIGSLVELHGQALRHAVRDMPDVYYAAERITFREWVGKSEHQLRRSDFFSDGVHPSKLTYRLWASEIGKIIGQKVVLSDT